MSKIDVILNKLSEPSTLRGLIAILAVVGVHIDTNLSDAIISFSVALIGLVEVIRKEKK